MDLEAVIGLEVHVQLSANSKVFCGCSTEFGKEPNTQTCPVCMGLPGSLPVFNKKALEYGIKTALALNCQIQNFVKFDRKHYFYPDLPKNYQISQYDLPLAASGCIKIETKEGLKKIAISRVHLEEDAGKLIHEEDKPYSLIDYNRTGVPLLEIVSEPDINSPDEAYNYLTALKLILKYLGVSDCDMEKGSLRCDANISVREKGARALGTKSELKNMNSFKAVKTALQFEYDRQRHMLKSNQKVVQETRLWDDKKQLTLVMRTKEEAHDYRYFPEPDLVPFIIQKDQIEEIKNNLPELPSDKLKRFVENYSLTNYEANILIQDAQLADYFEECFKIYPNAKNISNWITGPILSEVNARQLSIRGLGVTSKNLSQLIECVEKGSISNLIAKDVLKEMIDTGEAPAEIIKEKNLVQISDIRELDGIIKEVINANIKSVQDFKNGKDNALMFLVGQVMKKSSGKANPKIVKELLESRLKKTSNNNKETGDV